MKWHPDRAGNGNSPEAKEMFQKISQAYQILSREIKSQKRQASHQPDPEPSSDRDPGPGDDDVYSDVMLEYAVGLARSGFSRNEVKKRLSKNGCDANMATSIADRAFQFQETFNSKFNHGNNEDENGTDFKIRKFDFLSIQALLGNQNPDNSGRKKICYYQDIFNELDKKDSAGAIFLISKNRYLSKLFNRSILLFLLVAALVYYFPAWTRQIPLGLIDFFQLPNVILSLMLVWSVYRKLWFLSLIGLSIFTTTQMYYYYSMPLALEKDFTSILLISIACYLPFIFLTYLSNFFFYTKTKNIIESIDLIYPDLQEKQILVKNKGGVSRLSAMLSSIALVLYFLHMIPENGSLNNKVNWIFSIHTKTESKEIRQNKAKIGQAERLFRIAEERYQGNPPDYEQAKIAYIKAAKHGSLLSAYKLGYMYLAGKGVKQDDQKAFYYFNQAVNAPLASQPHNLSTATQWLSESYRSLGIMYLKGYGTRKNPQKAKEMFAKALNYAPSDKMKNSMPGNTLENRNLRLLVTSPEYSQ